MLFRSMQSTAPLQQKETSQTDVLDMQKIINRYLSKDIEVDSLHCALLQKGGSLVLENCQLNMMFSLDEKMASSYSTLTILEGSVIRISKCEIKSQRIIGITGITSIFADFWLSQSRIYDNFSGGIYVLSNEFNITQIMECKIYRNKIAGIILEGFCPKVLIRK